jgi:oligopeptide transport system ATP-binding protein
VTAVLEINGLVTAYPLPKQSLFGTQPRLRAVDGVSLALERGETIGVVGESGCGKSTLARTIVGLERPAEGNILLDGTDVHTAARTEIARQIQMVFQDPYTSLNPRRTVRQILTSVWKIHPEVVARDRWNERVDELLQLVGLSSEHADRLPHQFSGGQRQRIGIARALAVEPRVIVCDEPVSALDVSIQAQIINLMMDIQQETGVSYIFIAHDLAVVEHIARRVAVMYLGKIVEVGPAADIYANPRHPYTQALLSSVPPLKPWDTDRTPTVLSGDVPSPIDPPSGCRFRTRCWRADDRCAAEEPELMIRAGSDHPNACHYAEEMTNVP